ncbi:MAG: putative rane associated protein [Planctomycetaceae bacterium]|nr:putative rane associated protein [Planctomycetaceae bacterium]
MPSSVNRRLLDPERIIETSAQLQRRIAERFPASGLSRLAAELNQVARESALRAEEFNRPNIPLRIGIGVLVCAIIAFLITSIFSAGHTENLYSDLINFVQFLEAAISGSVFIGAAILFLVTLEMRMKRARALRDIREFRAIAHIVDMHQLTKDPELLFRGPSTPSSPVRAMSPFQLSRYLDYCIELLAVTGKVGALYVQNFPDSEALAAVEQVETLTTGLSRSIWQKMMILDQLPPSADAQQSRYAPEPFITGTPSPDPKPQS